MSAFHASTARQKLRAALPGLFEPCARVGLQVRRRAAEVTRTADDQDGINRQLGIGVGRSFGEQAIGRSEKGWNDVLPHLLARRDMGLCYADQAGKERLDLLGCLDPGYIIGTGMLKPVAADVVGRAPSAR